MDPVPPFQIWVVKQGTRLLSWSDGFFSSGPPSASIRCRLRGKRKGDNRRHLQQRQQQQQQQQDQGAPGAGRAGEQDAAEGSPNSNTDLEASR